MKQFAALAATLALTLTLGACASENFASGATAALPEKPKADPVCGTLAQKLDDLRKDGVTQRVEQASQGKGTTVSVKRESLAKVAEINKTNIEFQQKCSAYRPASVATTAPAPAPSAAPVAAAAKTAAVAKAAKPAAAAATTAGEQAVAKATK